VIEQSEASTNQHSHNDRSSTGQLPDQAESSKSEELADESDIDSTSRSEDEGTRQVAFAVLNVIAGSIVLTGEILTLAYIAGLIYHDKNPNPAEWDD